MADKFIITRHIRERYVQRTNKRFAKLQWSEREDQEQMAELRKDLEDLIKRDQWKIDKEIFQRLEHATDSRSFLNNTGFMEWYQQKYGFDKRFQFLVDDDLLFVIIMEKGRKIIVTCVSAKTHMAGKAVLASRRKKFRKKKEQDCES